MIPASSVVLLDGVFRWQTVAETTAGCSSCGRGRKWIRETFRTRRRFRGSYCRSLGDPCFSFAQQLLPVIFKNQYPSLRCAHSKAGPRPADVDMEPFHGRLTAYDTLIPSLGWMSRRLRQRRRRRAALPAPNRSPPSDRFAPPSLVLASVSHMSTRSQPDSEQDASEPVGMTRFSTRFTVS